MQCRNKGTDHTDLKGVQALKEIVGIMKGQRVRNDAAEKMTGIRSFEKFYKN
jgi:hypothetical protein